MAKNEEHNHPEDGAWHKSCTACENEIEALIESGDLDPGDAISV